MNDEEGEGGGEHEEERIESSTDSDTTNIKGAYKIASDFVNQIDYFYSDTDYATIESKLKTLANDVIEKEFKKTPEGEALLHLDTVHQELQDYIWSAGSETEQLFKTIGHVLNKKANIQLGYSKIALPDK